MLDVAVATDDVWHQSCEWETCITTAVEAAVGYTPLADLLDSRSNIEIAVRLTSDTEVHQLNAEWRGKDKPTNVLSFPQYEPADLDAAWRVRGEPEILLGDIVLAHETCAREAQEKGVTLAAHAMHLVVHGTLHLLGYDHIDEADAVAMEELERAIMASMGEPDPYAMDGAIQYGE